MIYSDLMLTMGVEVLEVLWLVEVLDVGGLEILVLDVLVHDVEVLDTGVLDVLLPRKDVLVPLVGVLDVEVLEILVLDVFELDVGMLDLEVLEMFDGVLVRRTQVLDVGELEIIA